MSDSYSSGAPLSGSESRGMPARIPHLSDIATSRQLVVQGKPFLIRGAELQNSSLTSADYMRPVWPKLIDGNVNTVLGCVTWEQIEPIEDRFDFSELDRIVIEARSHALHLILLWFGSWKNGIIALMHSKETPMTDNIRPLHLRSSLGQNKSRSLRASKFTKAQRSPQNCRYSFPIWSRIPKCRCESLSNSDAAHQGDRFRPLYRHHGASRERGRHTRRLP